jgi:hypothetical protein
MIEVDNSPEAKAAVAASKTLGGAWSQARRLGITSKREVIQQMGVDRFGQGFLDELRLLEGARWSLDEMLAAAYVLGRCEGKAGLDFSDAGAESDTTRADKPGSQEGSVSPYQGKNTEELYRQIFHAQDDKPRRHPRFS